MSCWFRNFQRKSDVIGTDRSCYTMINGKGGFTMNEVLEREEKVTIHEVEYTKVNNPDGFEDDPQWKVLLPTGTAWMAGFIVHAGNEQVALDAVVDYCEEKGLCELYYTIEDLNSKEIYEEEYICAGNHCLYVGIETRIEKL